MNNTKKFPLRTQKARSTRQRILGVATELFLAMGYSQTSLEKVATEAQTTKPTVYSHFKSKAGLFEAVINQHAEQGSVVFKKLLIPTNDPEDDLIRFGDVFLSFVLSPDQTYWNRLATAEAIAHPEVGEAFYQAGPARAIQQLTDYVASQAKAELLEVENPRRAAEQLIGLMLGVDLLQTQIGKEPPGKSALKTQCREAVAIFLAAYGTRTKG
ncbi:TetR/AcrR family transcriptional regulator C-terminal domain-containing protein [Acaryochloris sp. IP29b_bin.137]|uniref:TetR/AcrR family transcriptional regulator n=1 Tax=Acaryochloris sp. IP29b_bin.137 TaxID=2969217 RepID=UPI0026028593|nr:TetR/AcrR family transcriptional regulator C-terminal domain-containing protein [Acaryochloris sp. IP29b_bin.137]